MLRRRKLLLLVVALPCGAILLSVARHFQLRHAVEEYRAELKVRGELTDFAQIVPPEISAQENGAENFLRATALREADSSLLKTNLFGGMKGVAPGKALVCWQQPEVRDYDATNSWIQVHSALQTNREALELIRKAATARGIQFPIAYQRGVTELGYTNLHLAEFKCSAQYLGVAAMDDLRCSDAAAAITNLHAMLALAKPLQDQRLVISELVRIAITHIAATITWELLQSTNVTDAQLALIQTDWKDLDFINGYRDALAMERVGGEIALQKWRDSNSGLLNYLDQGRKARQNMGWEEADLSRFEMAKLKVKLFLWRNWWSYPDELRSLKGHAALVEAIRVTETNGAFNVAMEAQSERLEKLGILKLDNPLETMFSGEIDFHSMFSQSIVSLSGVLRRVMTVEAARQMVVTAIALKRHQLKHRSFPERLADLAPEFLATVPTDPVDGQPLRYRKDVDRTFLLYSVGENAKDDGGDPKNQPGHETSSYYWLGHSALDWVWPQPASAEEISTYYEHPPK